MEFGHTLCNVGKDPLTDGTDTGHYTESTPVAMLRANQCEIQDIIDGEIDLKPVVDLDEKEAVLREICKGDYTDLLPVVLPTGSPRVYEGLTAADYLRMQPVVYPGDGKVAFQQGHVEAASLSTAGGSTACERDQNGTEQLHTRLPVVTGGCPVPKQMTATSSIEGDSTSSDKDQTGNEQLSTSLPVLPGGRPVPQQITGHPKELEPVAMNQVDDTLTHKMTKGEGLKGTTYEVSSAATPCQPPPVPNDVNSSYGSFLLLLMTLQHHLQKTIQMLGLLPPLWSAMSYLTRPVKTQSTFDTLDTRICCNQTMLLSLVTSIIYVRHNM